MASFTAMLAATWAKNDSLLCVGLDPDPAKPPPASVSCSIHRAILYAGNDEHFATAGLGIARLPLWMVDGEIKSGALRRLLDSVAIAPYKIHAVFPSVRKTPVKARLFVDFIQLELASIAYFLGEQPG